MIWLWAYLAVAAVVFGLATVRWANTRLWRLAAQDFAETLLTGVLWLPIAVYEVLLPEPGRPTWYLKTLWRMWKWRRLYWVTGRTAFPMWARLFAPGGRSVRLNETEEEFLYSKRCWGKDGWDEPELQAHLAEVWAMAMKRKGGAA